MSKEFRGNTGLAPGTVIASRYEVIRCLGTGSMGMVYACRKRGTPDGTLFAVKVLFSDISREDKVQATRFRNEIFAAYGVDHPNVVKAWEYIRDGDLIAYSMEFITGGDLGAKLGRTSEPFTITLAVKLLRQMCAGVQAIHDAGIVHRDLKPENILLTEEGDVKIADFGIARLGGGGSPRKLTAHGGVIGTIDYVAPEYLLNSQIDARADIYAVGILGYEMITGEPPFRGDSVYDTLWRRVKFPPPVPSDHRQECPPELDEVIQKALATKPEDRFQTARDMLEALEDIPENVLSYYTIEAAQLAPAPSPHTTHEPTAHAQSNLVSRSGVPSAKSGHSAVTPPLPAKSAEGSNQIGEDSSRPLNEQTSEKRSGQRSPFKGEVRARSFTSDEWVIPSARARRTHQSTEISPPDNRALHKSVDQPRTSASEESAPRQPDSSSLRLDHASGRPQKSRLFRRDDLLLLLITSLFVLGCGLVVHILQSGLADSGHQSPRIDRTIQQRSQW